MAKAPATIRIEKVGGFAGFGAESHLKSDVEIDLSSLPDEQRDEILQMLRPDRDARTADAGADGFVYRFDWVDEHGERFSAEWAGNDVPDWVRASVVDRID